MSGIKTEHKIMPPNLATAPLAIIYPLGGLSESLATIYGISTVNGWGVLRELSRASKTSRLLS